MKSFKLVIKNDERHCMPHLYIHATSTLYSMHRLVVQVPSGNENLRGCFIDDVSSFESSESVYIYLYVYSIINFEVVSGCVRVPQERVPQDVACVWNKIDRLPTSGSVAAR